MLEAWFLFVKENFWGLLLVAVALIIVLSLVKTMVKWVILLLIVVGVYLYGANFVGNIQELVQQAAQGTMEQAIQLIIEEMKHAEYKVDKEGNYTITSNKMTLSGRLGSNEAILEIIGQKIPIQLDEALRKAISQMANEKK